LTETIEENERLKSTVRELRHENGQLKVRNRNLESRIEELEKTFDERVQEAVKRAVSEAVAPLYMEIERRGTEIERLKAELNKDSSNSSKPPSSDGFKKIPNNREASAKKRGGQRGHEGHTLAIPSNLDELVNAELAEHKIVDLTFGSAEYVTKWEIDIKTKVVYTEYRCPMGEVPTISYGNTLRGYGCLLLNEGYVSLDKASEIIGELTHGQVKPSVGTLDKMNREIAALVDTEALKSDLLNGEVLNVDETPMKCTEKPVDGEYETAQKTTFDVTVRTHSNSRTTLYTVNPRKNDEGIELDGIIPAFHGIMSHDHDKKYYKYGSPDLHATCHAHLSRELKGLAELYHIPWAADFRSFINEMNAYKQATTSCPDDKLGEFERRYDELLQDGYFCLGYLPDSFGRDDLRRMLNRLSDYKQNYLLFIRDYRAPFTNNLSERDLRGCKTKQKISGCFRSWGGLSDFAKIRSLFSTAKKRSFSLLDSITSLFPTPAE